MFDLTSLYDPMGLRYGASKLCQILIPLFGYILLRDLLIQRVFFRPVVRDRLQELLPKNQFFREFSTRFPTVFDQALGFMCWKIGCDLGFFLIATAIGPWSRAFTWSGLIPYTIVQYCVYFSILRRMVIDGARNPFANSPPSSPNLERVPLWKRLASKYLHEDLNATNEYVPMRQVVLKPFADYGGLVLSWSMYTVGIFFVQSGEFNWGPLVHFAFYEMFAFYLVNTYGFIIGYNLGEWMHFRIADVEEWLTAWGRRQEQAESPSPLAARLHRTMSATGNAWRELKDASLWQVEDFLANYGLGRKWAIASAGGVLCVILVAPSFSGLLFALGGGVGHLWFENFGRISEVQLAQTSQFVSAQASLPDAKLIIDEFPEIWQARYGGESTIAADPTAAVEVSAAPNEDRGSQG